MHQVVRERAREKANAAWVQVGDGARLELARRPWWRHIRLDFSRHLVTGDGPLRTLFLAQGFWASCVYRLSRSALGKSWLRPIALPVVAVAQKLVEIVTGISISPECEVGDGLYIGHYGSIFLPAGGHVGHNCSLAQNVCIGPAPGSNSRGVPVIGNRVFIGAHSVIVGPVTVGDDAMICAGAVVSRSVPARAVVMGNPARVISHDGSFEHVFYEGMEDDPARRASLARGRSLNVGPA
jgi:serine O-acetyltransferase